MPLKPVVRKDLFGQFSVAGFKMFDLMHLYIRADADSKIGTGHLMRCIALAQMWQDQGGKVTFLSHCESEGLQERILKEGFEFLFLENPHPDPSDLLQTLSLLTNKTNQPNLTNTTNQTNQTNKTNKTNKTIPCWLVLDGYHFTPEYQKTIHDAGISLLVIDDMNHLPYYHADIILNQNIDAQELKYCCNKDTTLLLGAQYVLLRREFLKHLDFKRQIPERAKNILVTLGGADPDNVTLKVIKALQLLEDPEIEVKIVIGPANPHKTILSETLSSTYFTAVLLTSPPDMPELIGWADIGISGGGSTCWEFGFMGLPSVLVILAKNQVELAAHLGRQQYAVNIGWYDKVSVEQLCSTVNALISDPNLRKSISKKASSLVDGQGALHVIKVMLGSFVLLRRAIYDDCNLVWQWSNEKETRKASFCQEPISWDEHVRWFKEKLADPNHVFFIATDGNKNMLGQIRYAIEDNKAIVSFSIAPEHRNRGYGSEFLKRAALKLFHETGVKEIIAFVRAESQISLKAFQNAGFTKVEELFFQGTKSDKLIVRKSEML